VIMTREGDYFVPLEVRAQIANGARDSIFVSIHFNATNGRFQTPQDLKSFRLPRGSAVHIDSAVAPSALSTQPGMHR